MGTFDKLAKKRKTTYEFSEDLLPHNKIIRLLETARWAPSCSNSQPWHFIIVCNKNKIEDLISTANYGDFHTTPAAIIAIVLREELCKGEGFACFRGKDSHVYDSYMSCGIVASYITLAAEDLGISSCIITPEQKKVKKILGVNNQDAVPLLVGLGKEKKGTFKNQRNRRNLKELISYENFKGKHNAR